MPIAAAAAALVVLVLVRYRARRTLHIRSASPRVFSSLTQALSARFAHCRAIPTRSDYSLHKADFEWTNSKSTKPIAPAWNRLCGGSKCLEDKRILGLILNQIPGALQTFSIANEADLNAFWTYHTKPGRDKRYWVLKDSRANGASGVWFLDLQSERDLYRAKEILALPIGGGHNAYYCLQEFCPGPLLLWEEGGGGARKFHFRITAVVCANARAFVHKLAFAHPANKPFKQEEMLDREVQLTNLCANMVGDHRSEVFEGEICLNLMERFPDLWSRVLVMWRETVDAAFRSGMRHQRRADAGDFEYVGLDVMANELGQVFLLEINSPPALYSATKQARADAQHVEMLGDLFRFIVLPALLLRQQDEESVTEFGGFVETGPPAKDVAVQVWPDWHSAQSKCDLLLMRLLFQARKRQDSLFQS